MSIEDAPPAAGEAAAEAPPASLSSAPAAGHPWLPGMTLLWGVLLLGGYFIVQALAMTLAAVPAMIEAVRAGGAADPMRALQERMGLLFTIGTTAAAPLTVAATLAIGWWGYSRQGIDERKGPLRRSLGLRRPRFLQIVLWTVVAAAVLAGYELLARLLDRPSLPDFMVEFHRTAGWLPGLLLVVVLVAPLVEELLFRGFLLPGLAAGRLGPAGAIVVTSLLFAAVHAQYDLFDMSAVLALGLLLGAARWFSGSLWLAYGLHAAVNALAAAQLVWALGW